LFLSKRCICSALIVDLPDNLLRLLISRFLSTLSHFVFILGFQATTVDVQVFESALGLGLKMNRTQPVVFFGVPRQDQLASYLHPLTGFQSNRVDGDGIEMLKFVEPLYVYAAFCGFVLGGTTEPEVASRCHDCLDAVDAALTSLRAGEVNEVKQANADALAQDLLARLAGNRAGAAGEWETDQKIVAMYSSDIDVDIPH
jgi:hypothetical protein